MTNPAILSVRVTQNERATLKAAAAQARTNVSDFVRRKALEAAEMDMLERREVVIPVEEWEAFEAWLSSSPRESTKMRERAAAKPIWQD